MIIYNRIAALLEGSLGYQRAKRLAFSKKREPWGKEGKRFDASQMKQASKDLDKKHPGKGAKLLKNKGTKIGSVAHAAFKHNNSQIPKNVEKEIAGRKKTWYKKNPI